MAGGGVNSHNPIDQTSTPKPEIHVAVEVGGNWGTYVTVHAYAPPRDPTSARRRCQECVEHGHLIDEPAAKLADEGIWWSLQ